ncbi:unnamed protein product, partial [Porites lobata]
GPQPLRTPHEVYTTYDSLSLRFRAENARGMAPFATVTCHKNVCAWQIEHEACNRQRPAACKPELKVWINHEEVASKQIIKSHTFIDILSLAFFTTMRESSCRCLTAAELMYKLLHVRREGGPHYYNLKLSTRTTGILNIATKPEKKTDDGNTISIVLPFKDQIAANAVRAVRKWKRKISKLDKDIRDKTSATLNRTKQGKRTLSPNIVSHLTEKRNLSELLFCEIKLDCKNKALNVEQKDW